MTNVFGETPQVVTYGSDNQVRIMTKFRDGGRKELPTREESIQLIEGLKIF